MGGKLVYICIRISLIAGVAQTQATVAKGERWGTSRAFLHPALNRTNLHVLDLAHVTKVKVKVKSQI
jgi:choline dehydrogenase-like flavoprotein